MSLLEELYMEKGGFPSPHRRERWSKLEGASGGRERWQAGERSVETGIEGGDGEI